MEVVERRSYCRICPAQCGIVVTVERGPGGERVTHVRGDESHPLTGGYTCPKGRALPAFHHHPDRLDHPRLDGRTVPWDVLLDDLARRLDRILAAHGPDAVGAYFGTWSWLDALGRRSAERLLRVLHSHSTYSALTVDAVARSYVAELMGGSSALLPNLDPERTGLVILVGTNPVVSHGHASGLPDPLTRLRVVAGRAGLWVLDPLRTETARLATRHLAVRPGADRLVLGHVVRQLLLEGGADTGYLDEHATGVDGLAAAVAPWTADVVAARAGIAPGDLADLVAAVRASGRVTVLTGTGTTMSPQGNLTEWMAWALQVVTGSFDRPGGAWFNPGFLTRLDRRRLPRGDGTAAAAPPSRPDLPSRFGERPCAALADEIEAGNIKALLVIGGSPLTALPDTARLRAAFGRLDVLAVADVVETDTVAAATHVLPVAGQLERADVTAFVELFLSAVAVQRTPAVVATVGERRPLWWALGSLARRLGRDVLDGGLDPATADEAAVLDAFLARVGADPAVLGPTGDGAGVRLDEVARPYGWVTGHALPDGRWRLAPVPLVEQLASEEDDRRDGTRGPLVLVPRRVVRRMNSAVGDRVPTAARPEDTAALVHPDDAAAAGLGDGDPVRIRSAVGVLDTEVRLRRDLVAGTVSVPHGLPGRNVSLLTDARPGSVDPLTGMIVQSGLPVTLERIATADGEGPDGR